MINTVVSSEVTGNIGSCEIKETSVITSHHLMYEEVTNYAVNSCTGEVEQFHGWDYSAFSGILLILFFLSLAGLVVAGFIKLVEKITY